MALSPTKRLDPWVKTKRYTQDFSPYRDYLMALAKVHAGVAAYIEYIGIDAAARIYSRSSR